jgi:membrane protein
MSGLLVVQRIPSVLGSSLRNAWRHRILGLSAEAGFWQLLSLPSLAFALLGLLGYLDSWLGADTIATVRTDILNASANVLTPEAVDSVVRPVLDGVLHGGRAGVVSIGFAVSLWSGSSGMATFVNTIAIAYDQRDLRGAVASRLLALGLFIASILGTVLVVPVLILGPGVIRSWKVVADHPVISQLVNYAYWPTVGLLSLLMLCSLYHFAPPRRPRWRDTVPGALAAAALWLVGATGLRTYIDWVFHRTLDYGALSSPVAVLLYCYLTALAVLLGAEINAEIDRRRADRLARTL